MMVLDEADKNLVLFIPFSEGAPDNVTVSKVLDRSQGQNNGTVVGAKIVKPYEDMSIDSDDEGDNPLVIIDDGQAAFWTATNWGAGSYTWTLSDETTIVKKGANSLKIQRSAGANAALYLDHVYGAVQDWSQYDYFSIWVYGANSGVGTWIRIDGNDGSFSDYFSYLITDDFTGWKRFFIPLERFTVSLGAPSWATVKTLRIFDSSGIGETYYVDRLTVDVGNWRFGEAGDFDGTNDLLTIAGTAWYESPNGSYSLWFNSSDLTSVDYGLLSVYRICLRVGANNAFQNVGNYLVGVIYDGSWLYVSYDVSSLVDQWIHVVLTWTDSGNMLLFVNGVQVDSQAIGTVIYDGSSLFSVGKNLINNVYFDGLIDEVRVYNRALTAQEVRTLYLQGSRR